MRGVKELQVLDAVSRRARRVLAAEREARVPVAGGALLVGRAAVLQAVQARRRDLHGRRPPQQQPDAAGAHRGASARSIPLDSIRSASLYE